MFQQREGIVAAPFSMLRHFISCLTPLQIRRDCSPITAYLHHNYGVFADQIRRDCITNSPNLLIKTAEFTFPFITNRGSVGNQWG
jgi:hypothetical protein